MISTGLKKGIGTFLGLGSNIFNFKASRRHGQDFDAVVGFLTLDVLNCPALESVEGGSVAFSVFRFPFFRSSRFFRAKRLGIEHRYNCRGAASAGKVLEIIGES